MLNYLLLRAKSTSSANLSTGQMSDIDYYYIANIAENIVDGSYRDREELYQSLATVRITTLNGTSLHGMFRALEMYFKELCHPQFDQVPITIAQGQESQPAYSMR